jgi:hypothetical protein
MHDREVNLSILNQSFAGPAEVHPDQSFARALLAGLLAGTGALAVWLALSLYLQPAFWFGLVLQGLMIGVAVRVFGKGIDTPFGLLALAIALAIGLLGLSLEEGVNLARLANGSLNWDLFRWSDGWLMVMRAMTLTQMFALAISMGLAFIVALNDPPERGAAHDL